MKITTEIFYSTVWGINGHNATNKTIQKCRVTIVSNSKDTISLKKSIP